MIKLRTSDSVDVSYDFSDIIVKESKTLKNLIHDMIGDNTIEGNIINNTQELCVDIPISHNTLQLISKIITQPMNNIEYDKFLTKFNLETIIECTEGIIYLHYKKYIIHTLANQIAKYFNSAEECKKQLEGNISQYLMKILLEPQKCVMIDPSNNRYDHGCFGEVFDNVSVIGGDDSYIALVDDGKLYIYYNRHRMERHGNDIYYWNNAPNPNLTLNDVRSFDHIYNILTRNSRLSKSNRLCHVNGIENITHMVMCPGLIFVISKGEVYAVTEGQKVTKINTIHNATNIRLFSRTLYEPVIGGNYAIMVTTYNESNPELYDNYYSIIINNTKLFGHHSYVSNVINIDPNMEFIKMLPNDYDQHDLTLRINQNITYYDVSGMRTRCEKCLGIHNGNIRVTYFSDTYDPKRISDDKNLIKCEMSREYNNVICATFPSHDHYVVCRSDRFYTLIDILRQFIIKPTIIPINSESYGRYDYRYDFRYSYFPDTIDVKDIAQYMRLINKMLHDIKTKA